MTDVCLIPHTTNPIGMTQLRTMLAGRVSIAPAAMWKGTIAANTVPHISVRRRLTDLNLGLDHSSCGTSSRAYCSVKGTDAGEANALRASSAAAIARA